MLKYDIEQNNIEKSEFLSKAEIQGLTTYSKEQVQEYANMYKSLMSKAEVQELSQEETVQMKIFKSELESLKKVTVIDDKLQKSDMYYRSKDDISKSEAIESDFKTLSLQNECEVLVKAFEAEIITEETLEKAIGGKYFKREPKPGGGYKYYYTEAQYKKEKGIQKEVTDKQIDSDIAYGNKIEAIKKRMDNPNAKLGDAMTSGGDAAKLKEIQKLKEKQDKSTAFKERAYQNKIKQSESKQESKGKDVSKQQQSKINKLTKKYGIDKKASRIEKENDGTQFYHFKSAYGNGYAYIQENGEITGGNLGN